MKNHDFICLKHNDFKPLEKNIHVWNKCVSLRGREVDIVQLLCPLCTFPPKATLSLAPACLPFLFLKLIPAIEKTCTLWKWSPSHSITWEREREKVCKDFPNLDCHRLPLFHTRPKDGSQLGSVCELWSKLAPTRFGGSFFSFSCSSAYRKERC